MPKRAKKPSKKKVRATEKKRPATGAPKRGFHRLVVEMPIGLMREIDTHCNERITTRSGFVRSASRLYLSLVPMIREGKYRIVTNKGDHEVEPIIGEYPDSEYFRMVVQMPKELMRQVNAYCCRRPRVTNTDGYSVSRTSVRRITQSDYIRAASRFFLQMEPKFRQRTHRIIHTDDPRRDVEPLADHF